MTDDTRSRPRQDRLARRAIEEAERRVQRDMAEAATGDHLELRRRRLLLGAAAVLFAVTFIARCLVNDPGALVGNFYAIPIALLAVTFGFRAGVAAGLFAIALIPAWSLVTATHIGVLGYTTRGAVYLMVGAVVGYYAERLPRAAARGRGAEYELEVRNEELERTNAYLAQAVMRLEAFAEIARAVGGETDLQRVLQLILDEGRAVAGARAAVVYLREDADLVAVAATEPGLAGRRVPARGSLPGFVLAGARPQRVEQPALGFGEEASVLAPLSFRGETFGVVALVDRQEDGPAFDEEDEELLQSVAASAATAVITAQSVARERLRDSIAAAEEARRRWARELHDETLQGLAGLRVLLSSALLTGSPGRLREIVQDAVALTKGEIDSLRALIAELRPAALDELGLEPALEHLAERSAAAGLQVSTRFDLSRGHRDAERLAPETESTIYRVVQEALNNVTKHAHAEHVEVAVERSNGGVRVQVSDDGRGFDPTRECTGLGLVGMRERVELAGGELAIESQPEGPTIVRAHVPAV